MFRALLLATLSSTALAQTCANVPHQPLGVLIETPSTIYDYAAVSSPSQPTVTACINTLFTNQYPAASTPAVNSVATKAFPIVFTLATNPATKQCGFRAVQAGSPPVWNITLPEKYAYLCPSDPSLPSLALSITPQGSGLIVSANNYNYITLLTVDWDGNVGMMANLQNIIPGTPTTASSDGVNLLAISYHDSATLWWPIPADNTLKTTSLGYGVQGISVAQDVEYEQFVMLYSVVSGSGVYYTLDVALPMNANPPSNPPALPIVGNSGVLASRNAFTEVSHDWWQFIDNNVLAKYSINSGAVQFVTTFNASASSVPWSVSDNINVLAVPLA